MTQVLPKRSELANFAAPNCPSVSHVAFAGIREEPTLWQLGQAAGTAAAIALRSGHLAMHDVDVAELQRELLAQHTFVHWPVRDNCSSPIPPPAPPPASVHEKCAANRVTNISVHGAGTSSVNGVYTKETVGTMDGMPMFRLDSSHFLYRWGGNWRLGNPGHGLTYECVVANADGPPNAEWTVSTLGAAPAPTIAC